MGIVTGLTAARMLAIEAASVISGTITGDNLILTKFSGATVNAGNVRGPKGDAARNRIINGAFQVNQRAFNTVTTYGYGFDRWLLHSSGGTVVLVDNVSGLDNSVPEATKTTAFVQTTGHTLTTHYGLLQQRVENVQTLSGKTVTVSFYAKSSVNGTKVAVELGQNFGTGGSPSAPISIPMGYVTLTTTMARYSKVITLAHVGSKILGSDANDYLELNLWLSAGSTLATRASSIGLQARDASFWGIQLEEGSVANPYEQKTYAEELRACQRYYEVRNCTSNLGNDILAVCYASTAPAIGTWQYLVPKRAQPVLSFPTNGSARYVSTISVATAQTMVNYNRSTICASIRTTANQSTGVGWFDDFVVVANAEL